MKPWDEGREPVLTSAPLDYRPASRPPENSRRFALVCGLLALAIALLAVFIYREQLGLVAMPPLTASEVRRQAGQCQARRDFACAETGWRHYIELRPDEDYGVLHLGILLNEQDRHAEAVEQFDRALHLGGGGYDLFAYYGDSLSRLGRNDEAIDWFYKALSAAPGMSMVRSQLAKLLTAKGRYYEAMALLQAQDSEAEAHGRTAPFTGQRIAIESLIQASTDKDRQPEARALKVPAFKGHFSVPVTLGQARPMAYIVDTGATRTTVGAEALRQSGARYRVLDTRVQMTMADGHRTVAQMVLVSSMKVGPFPLRDVVAISCEGCALLLGQSTLSQFDIQSSKTGGVEFLTLSRRSRA